MSFDLVIVLAVLAGAVVLFVTEILPVDLVAMVVLAVLLLSGVVSPAQAFSGFSNEATVTVAAMFVLSAGLYKTGLLNRLGDAFVRLARRNFWLALIGMMLGIGATSAFINNTAAVAVSLPIVIRAARDSRISASKFLMPLSFAAMLGGVCTLIGTSTNILVSSIAEQHGLRGFGMFEMSRLGLIFFATGTLYMLLLGVRLIPERRGAHELTESFQLKDYLTEIVLLPDSPSVGKPLREAPLVQDLDLDVIEIRRAGRRIVVPFGGAVLEANDVLRIRCNLEKLGKLSQTKGVQLKPRADWSDAELQAGGAVLVEAVVAPNSVLEGRSLADVDFRNTFGATALALRHRGALLRERIGRTPLRAGDALLIEVHRDRLQFLQGHDAFVVVSEVTTPEFRAEKVLPAVAVMATVVALPTLGVMPIGASATAGAIAMVLFRCLTLEEAYQAMEWKVVFLLAGVLTLGIALDESGGSALLSSGLVRSLGPLGPVAMVSAFYLITSLLTSVISNNATAALLAPVALAAAQGLGVDARPFLMAIAFAGSASFMTPVGYQTNTMIFGAGHYRFTDFTRVGAPLNLIFWLMATILIPVFWGF